MSRVWFDLIVLQTYDSFKRWYIGNELGSDTNVYAFIYANKNDLVVDSSDQIWTEHISNTNQWSQNPNIKLLLKQESTQQQQQPPPIQNNNERRPPMPGGGNNNNINSNNNQNQNQNQNNMDSENMVPPGQTDNNINQRNQRAQQYQNRQANRQQRERENAQEKGLFFFKFVFAFALDSKVFKQKNELCFRFIFLLINLLFFVF